MFFISYLSAELRRRRGRTALTAAGLGVGIALVVMVGALSQGLDDAQSKVLEPLTGVGTDMSVTRPLDVDGSGGGLSDEERQQLEQEGGGARVPLDDLGDPGDTFETDNFVSTGQLSFDQSAVDGVAALDGVAGTSGYLTLNSVHISGTVPERSEGGFGQAPEQGTAPGPPDNIDVQSVSVTGVDTTTPDLAPVTAGQVTSGAYFSGGAREAVLSESYAKSEQLAVGDSFTLGDTTFTVVGLATAPLGGAASEAYVPLATLQNLADREGRINGINLRAASGSQVASVAAAIPDVIDGASVTTAEDLADRVGGSLADAGNIADRLGTALAAVGLLAAVLFASLLTLGSVNKRVRELGTLKAIGWPQRLVVRQVAGEAVAQGLLGGVVGAALGLAGAFAIEQAGFTLEATVAAAQPAAAAVAGPGGGPGPVFGLGRADTSAASELITIGAPVDPRLLLLAAALALLAGLLAGAAGGLRAARLRPADALRHLD